MSNQASQQLAQANGIWNNSTILPPMNLLLPTNANTTKTLTTPNGNNSAIPSIVNNQFTTPFLQTNINSIATTMNHNLNLNSSPSTPTPTGSSPISNTNTTTINNNKSNNANEYKYTLPNSINKYKHKQDPSNKSSIIQCPNPTHNPILNHQKQEEIALSKAKQIQNGEYILELESKVTEQEKLIQSLLSQNQLLQTQLAQHKNQISMLSTQNNTLLSAYNTLQSQWKSAVFPSLSNKNNHKQTRGQTQGAMTRTESAGKWSVNDVMSWIGNIANGIYNKYAYLFCLNNIDGVQLMNITRSDLEKMGITDNKEQTLLLQHIQRLKRLNSNSNSNSMSSSLQCASSPAMNGSGDIIEGQIDTK